MCDYSLMHLPNRLAREGEALVVHRFPSGSKGLTSPDDLHPKPGPDAPRHSFWTMVKDFFNPENACSLPAVCIPPGARLRLQDIGEDLQRKYKLASDEEVTFEQLSEVVNTYRDAVCFRNGLKLRLQELSEGQRVTVVSLAESQERAAESELEPAWRDI